MATSTVSALDQDTYQLIATNTPTSGSTTTFSSLSGYKKYMLSFDLLTQSSGGTIALQFNGINSKYYGGVHIAGSTTYQASNDYIYLYYNAGSIKGVVEIFNVNNGAPRIVDGVTNYQSGATSGEICFVKGGWYNTTPITSISILCNGTWTSGSVSLFGIAG
jgi:hypothetical protein